jgi:hypothetical protein
VTGVEVRWASGYDAATLLRELAVEVTGADPGPLHHLCPTCGAVSHGRPGFDADVEVSVARADGLVLVALSVAGPVGVDVTAGSGAGARHWVRTEAVAKARGTGLVVEHDLGAPDLWISDLDLAGPFTAAVAGVGDELSAPPEVRVAPRRTATR